MDGGATDDGRQVGGSAVVLPVASAREEVIADYRAVGLSLADHPLSFERPWLADRGVITAAQATTAPEGKRVCVAGIVLVRQRPATASGMLFLTIEDETGAANVVVRPAVWEAADPSARRAVVLLVHGRIQRRGTVVHLLATRLEAAPQSPEGGASGPVTGDPRSVAGGAVAGGQVTGYLGPTAGGGDGVRPPALPRMSRDFR